MNNSQPWQKYPLIRKPLEEVNQLIQATIRTPYSDLQDALLEWLVTVVNIYGLVY